MSTNGNKLKWRDRVVGFERRPAKDFQAHPLNFRRHPNNQRDAFRGVLSEIGFAGAVLENTRTGNLIDGHLRIEEALSIDENQLIPCVQVDLSENEEKLLLSTYDPISAMAATDKDALEMLLKDVSASSDAVDSLLADIAKKNGVVLEQKDVPDAQIDRAAELQEKWKVKRGDLYEIASQTAPNKIHRLLCGDATEKADVRAVCGDNKPLLMVTDPPYGVDYDGGEINIRKREKLEGDYSSDLYAPAFAVSPSNVAYAWFAGTEALAVYGAAKAGGFEPRALLIWNKLKAHYGAPSAHYKQRSEPCLYAVRKGNSANWIGDMTEPTVWDIEQPHINEYHSTQKPLECMARPIRNHSGDVYDPFVGSGTTICAAEINKRACYAIEIKPEYCSVTLERLSLMGLEPKLVQEAHGKAA